MRARDAVCRRQRLHQAISDFALGQVEEGPATRRSFGVDEWGQLAASLNARSTAFMRVW